MVEYRLLVLVLVLAALSVFVAGSQRRGKADTELAVGRHRHRHGHHRESSSRRGLATPTPSSAHSRKHQEEEYEDNYDYASEEWLDDEYDEDDELYPRRTDQHSVKRNNYRYKYDSRLHPRLNYRRGPSYPARGHRYRSRFGHRRRYWDEDYDDEELRRRRWDDDEDDYPGIGYHPRPWRRRPPARRTRPHQQLRDDWRHRLSEERDYDDDYPYYSDDEDDEREEEERRARKHAARKSRYNPLGPAVNKFDEWMRRTRGNGSFRSHASASRDFEDEEELKLWKQLETEADFDDDSYASDDDRAKSARITYDDIIRKLTEERPATTATTARTSTTSVASVKRDYRNTGAKLGAKLNDLEDLGARKESPSNALVKGKQGDVDDDDNEGAQADAVVVSRPFFSM